MKKIPFLYRWSEIFAFVTRLKFLPEFRHFPFLNRYKT